MSKLLGLTDVESPGLPGRKSNIYLKANEYVSGSKVALGTEIEVKNVVFFHPNLLVGNFEKFIRVYDLEKNKEIDSTFEEEGTIIVDMVKWNEKLCLVCFDCGQSSVIRMYNARRSFLNEISEMTIINRFSFRIAKLTDIKFCIFVYGGLRGDILIVNVGSDNSMRIQNRIEKVMICQKSSILTSRGTKDSFFYSTSKYDSFRIYLIDYEKNQKIMEYDKHNPVGISCITSTLSYHNEEFLIVNVHETTCPISSDFYHIYIYDASTGIIMSKTTSRVSHYSHLLCHRNYLFIGGSSGKMEILRISKDMHNHEMVYKRDYIHEHGSCRCIRDMILIDEDYKNGELELILGCVGETISRLRFAGFHFLNETQWEEDCKERKRFVIDEMISVGKNGENSLRTFHVPHLIKIRMKDSEDFILSLFFVIS